MKQQEIEKQLADKGVDFEIITHDKPIKSRKDALQYFKLEEAAPTLVLDSGSEMFAMIISGARDKIDFEHIREKLGCSRLGMASKNDIKEKLKMNPGEVAMVGHGLPCILDKKLFDFPYVFGGIGDAYKTLRINPFDIEKVNEVLLKID